MRRVHKLLSAIFAILMIVLSACSASPPASVDGSEKAQPVTEENTPVAAETEAETEKVYTDSVPELDFGGDKLTFTTIAWYDYEMFAEELNGDITNDAVFNRNKMMEDRFNVSIDTIPINNATHAEHPAFIRSSIMAGDHAFDVAATFVYSAGSMILDNIFQDWRTIPYVELDRPWWIANINKAFTVYGKLYSPVSDTCVTSMQLAYAYLFNAKLAIDHNVEDLYKVVDEGRWTMDYIYNIITLTRSRQELETRIKELHAEGFFPLPDRDYSQKYKWFRRMTNSSFGRNILLCTLPYLKRER